MILRLLAALALLVSAAVSAGAAEGRPGQFDFYVLSLSWSPSYCQSPAGASDALQCRLGRPYAFVVHGLWPQYEKGYPEDCARPVPALTGNLTRSMLDLMPSPRLIAHEWATHGTCSGLAAPAYFDLVRAARAKIAIPPPYLRPTAYRTVTPAEVERSFISANPGLGPEMIAVQCDRTRLREVRICLTKSLDFRTCPDVNRQSCATGKRLSVPPLR